MDVYMKCVGLIFLEASLLILSSESAALNDYILDYQPLHFNPSHLHEKHNRMKREIDPYLQWNFKAYGRTFNLHLQPAKSIFTDNHDLVIGENPPQRVDTSFIYEGTLAGVLSSSAYISIINGSVSGHVIVPADTTYHIEPARNHFKNSEFHTLIYPESKMNLDPFRHKRNTFETCGGKEIYTKLNKMWQPVDSSENRSKKIHWHETSYNKYSSEANTGEALLRKKRDFQKNARTCTMSLQADNLLFKHYLQKHGGDNETAKVEILALFASHIKALNDIYGQTKFVRSDKPDVYFQHTNFQLQRTKIMDTCEESEKEGFCNDNLDVSNFLDLTAKDKFDDFCLVHTFTYRDFVGGTLGLAWVATAQSPNAGICGKYGDVRDSNNGISKRSLNTGIVTLINFKQEVPPRVSQLTFAHEVGHNFGSQHDTTEKCAPYGTGDPSAADGNYIMFPSATQGNLPNNRQFSSCSKDSIAKVLETLAPAGRRVSCFVESNQPFCGNKIVEEGEECDCGVEEECKGDKCCIGRSNTNPSSSCKRPLNITCSPSEGPCCNPSCGFISDSICLKETECSASSNCTGLNATCPKPASKEDYKTFCSHHSKVCVSGECIGSVCQNINWTECFLTSSETTDVEQMCYVSCKKNITSECISSFDGEKVEANPEFKKLLFEISNTNSANSQGVKRPAGSPCNNYKGYCDVFSKCRNVDAEGPFRQLTDMIFKEETWKTIKTWIEDHWWAVLLMCIGVIVFMAVFVKIFEYNTPSRDPKKKNQTTPAARSQPVSRPHQDKRSGPYTTDVPMHNRGDHSGNQGYHNYAFQGSPLDQDYDSFPVQRPTSSRGQQQFDRISKLFNEIMAVTS